MDKVKPVYSLQLRWAGGIVSNYYLIFSWCLHVWNRVAVAAYSRPASRSQAKFQTLKLSPLSALCADLCGHPHLRRALYPPVVHSRFSPSDLFSAGAGGWVPGHCYSVPYMKIPAENQVIFIKDVVAVAAYRSCRLSRRVKMSWIHYLLCDHHWTQCRHAISDTGHVT